MKAKRFTPNSPLRTPYSNDPWGNRTPVPSVRGWRPEPLDERAVSASGRNRTSQARRRRVYNPPGIPVPADT